MSRIPYMPFYVNDYLSDTIYLTDDEDLAYMRLIMAYWQMGKALPAESERLARICRFSNERWASVERTLQQFFNVVDGKWQHKRIEAELEKAKDKLEKAITAGRASANKRKIDNSDDNSTQNQRPFNARSTPVQHPLQQTFNHKGLGKGLGIGKGLGEELEKGLEKETDMSGEPDAPPQKNQNNFLIPAKRILDYLNLKSGKRFEHVKANLNLIIGRLREKHTETTLMAVVDLKCKAWLTNPKMYEYLRPKTIFSAENFNNYVGELGSAKPMTDDEKFQQAMADPDFSFEKYINQSTFDPGGEFLKGEIIYQNVKQIGGAA